MSNRSMLMINIVPVIGDHVDFAVSEIRRQAREVGLRRFALSLSFHPEGTPARDKIGKLAGQLRAVREGLEGSGLELGVLIQSTLGHGWNGKVPLTEEPWQKIVTLEGTESPRMCPLEPDFADYVHDCIIAVMREKPAFLLVDDDFGLRGSECYCPRHLAAYNKALGKERTLEDYRKMIAERPWDDPEVLTVSRMRRDTLLPLARRIREAIDEIDPSVRCGYCTPYAGHGFVRDVALILAGGTRPFIRVNNDTYCMTPASRFFNQVGKTHRIRYQMEGVEDVIDEADTFPHNYYSESAAMFHTHVTLAMLDGLVGCKLWMSEFGNPVDLGSQRDYEKRFHDNLPFYERIFEAVDGIRWKGVSEILYHTERALHPVVYSAVHPETDWNTDQFGRYGFPIRYEAPSSEGIYAICMEEVKDLTDDEIRKLLSGALLVDATSAKLLTKRGFEKLLGVRATDGDLSFSFSGEIDLKTGLQSSMMWDEDMALLEPLSDDVEVAARFMKGNARLGPCQEIDPSMTFYRNELGGRVVVVGWVPTMPMYKTTRPQRRPTLERALDFLEGGPFEMGIDTGRPFLVRHGVMKDGSELLAFLNLSYDSFDKVPLRLLREPVSVDRLTPSGVWSPLPWRRLDPERIELEARAVVCEPVVLRFRFPDGK